MLEALCNAVDRVNTAIGRYLGPVIIIVSFAVLYEVVSRSMFARATLWASEFTVYASAAVYLLAGGYAMLERRHVRIDVIYAGRSQRARRTMDLLALPFLAIYALTLVVVGGEFAWASYLLGERTGTPWNPPIWPVKAAIPLAGLLLLLQALVNLLRELGYVRLTAPRA
ncbi:MAG TPA: TRAP transporter small permease subunit [Burkholderiaceae bacterium]|jgi:TRAP-type mannitol/chloroaromatic compound transport system permease small subunit|nr:TRAP transporter small permease subunit [Burkholderiaceae bacterium]